MKRKKRQFPSLASLMGDNAESRRLRVCIVTPDLIGPVKNGGIGTACANLAYTLAEAGHEVDVLFTRPCSSGAWQKNYAEKGININFLEQEEDCNGYFPDYPPLIISFKVYSWLENHSCFDIALFMEWMGNGFYTMQAKKSGQAFAGCALVVITHSPSVWHGLYNAALQPGALSACLWHMERKSIELADAVISPSLYMLEWLHNHGYKLPENVYWQPNPYIAPSVCERPQARIEEVVFFGRLEYRKGLDQFCSALDVLAKEGNFPKKISFLGKCGLMGSQHSLEYIAKRSKNWKESEISLLLQFNSNECIQYLSEGGRLAVMPSVAENSPYTVYECLAGGIPFLARDVGGIGELIEQTDRQRILFGQTPSDLAHSIREVYGKNPVQGRLAFSLAGNNKAWQLGLPLLAQSICSAVKKTDATKPFISVCLTHHDRPELLKLAVRSFETQTYKNFELILADDGSEKSESRQYLEEIEPAFKMRGWTIMRLNNGYVGRARNQAAANARGSWLLFFDDDNIAAPHLLECCAKAAAKCEDCLVAIMFSVFSGPGEADENNRRECFLPTGDLIAYSAIHNTLADATALMSKKVFMKAGGFSEDYGLGHEDFELYLRMAIAGVPIYVLPKPLFWYRRIENSMLNRTHSSANRMRSLRPFLDMLAPPFGELALMANCLAEETGMFPSSMTRGRADNDLLLEELAMEMDKRGLSNFATQIMVSVILGSDNANTRLSRLAAEGINQAKKGDAAVLEATLAHFRDELAAREESSILNNFYMAVLENLPATDQTSELREKLLSFMKNAAGDLRLWLFMAREYAGKDNTAAGGFFMKALLEADAIYLSSRPDVAEAVRLSRFSCGLHHFILHGICENSQWPARKQFEKTVECLIPFLPVMAAAFAKLKPPTTNGMAFSWFVKLGNCPECDGDIELK